MSSDGTSHTTISRGIAVLEFHCTCKFMHILVRSHMGLCTINCSVHAISNIQFVQLSYPSPSSFDLTSNSKHKIQIIAKHQVNPKGEPTAQPTGPLELIAWEEMNHIESLLLPTPLFTGGCPVLTTRVLTTASSVCCTQLTQWHCHRRII